MSTSNYPENLQHVPLHSKRDFVDVIKLRILRQRDLDYLGGSSVITRVPTRWRQEGHSQRENVRTKAEKKICYTAGFEGRGKGP